MSRAFIGLGSNLDDPQAQVRAALRRLGSVADTRLLAHSSLYASAPLGPPGQPDYVNAAAMLETGLDPHGLLDELQALERQQGRVRDGTRWGPRILDLDLLLFGRRRIRDHRLTVPHPEMSSRNFVLAPLLEIAPDVEIPGAGSAQALLDALGTAGLERLDP